MFSNENPISSNNNQDLAPETEADVEVGSEVLPVQTRTEIRKILYYFLALSFFCSAALAVPTLYLVSRGGVDLIWGLARLDREALKETVTIVSESAGERQGMLLSLMDFYDDHGVGNLTDVPGQVYMVYFGEFEEASLMVRTLHTEARLLDKLEHPDFHVEYISYGRELALLVTELELAPVDEVVLAHMQRQDVMAFFEQVPQVTRSEIQAEYTEMVTGTARLLQVWERYLGRDLNEEEGLGYVFEGFQGAYKNGSTYNADLPEISYDVARGLGVEADVSEFSLGLLVLGFDRPESIEHFASYWNAHPDFRTTALALVNRFGIKNPDYINFYRLILTLQDAEEIFRQPLDSISSNKLLLFFSLVNRTSDQGSSEQLSAAVLQAPSETWSAEYATMVAQTLTWLQEEDEPFFIENLSRFDGTLFDFSDLVDLKTYDSEFFSTLYDEQGQLSPDYFNPRIIAFINENLATQLGVESLELVFQPNQFAINSEFLHEGITSRGSLGITTTEQLTSVDAQIYMQAVLDAYYEHLSDKDGGYFYHLTVPDLMSLATLEEFKENPAIFSDILSTVSRLGNDQIRVFFMSRVNSTLPLPEFLAH